MQRLMAGGRSEATLPRNFSSEHRPLYSCKTLSRDNQCPGFSQRALRIEKTFQWLLQFSPSSPPQIVTEEESETNFSSDRLEQLSHKVHS